MAGVRFCDVRKSFGDTEVIHGVNVEVHPGEFVVLVGPSGCGKSTLLRLVAGLEQISSGEIYIGDVLVNTLPPKERDIAMVFQNYALYPNMTVLQNMAFGLKLRRMEKSLIAKKVHEAASVLEIDSLLGRYPRQLSGGQRQRVAMGRCIVRDPQVFLFDEPLSNLDAKLRVQMRAEIKDLHQRLEATSIYVTHDQIEAMTMADNIVVMRDGKVEQTGTPLELYDFPANTFVAEFIGSPAMNFLNGTFRRDGDRARVETEEGTPLPVDGTVGGYDGQAVVYGARPEHFVLTGNGSGIPAHVVVIEPTGASTSIFADMAGHRICAVFSERHMFSPGEKIHLEPKLDAVRLFEFLDRGKTKLNDRYYLVNEDKQEEAKMELNKILLAACAAVVLVSATYTAKAAEIIYPSFMWGEKWNALFLNELKKSFEAENPGAKVNGINVPISSFWDKQYADVTAGNAPDIITVFDPDVGTYMEPGLLEPLNDYIEKAGFSLDQFIPTAQLAWKDGKVYGVPMQVNSRALLFNEALLKEAGLEVPTNVYDFYHALKVLRQPDKQQFGYAIFSKPGAANVFYIEMSPITIGYGGGFFKQGKPRVTDFEFVNALKFYKQIYDEGLIPRGVDHSTYRQMFIHGKIAMYGSGEFMVGGTAAGNEETYKNFQTTDLPFWDGRSFTLSTFLGIPKGAPNKDLAAKFLMTMLQDKWQQRVVEIIKAYPARKNMVPNSFKKENPWFAAFERAALTAKSYAPEGAERYGPEIMKIIATHMEGMLFKGVEAEKMAKELQADLEKFMASKS